VKRGNRCWINAAHNTNVDTSDPENADDLGPIRS
jgi:hypothetical protein